MIDIKGIERLVIVVVVVVLFASTVMAAGDKVLFERWYELSMMGEPAGSLHLHQSQKADRVTSVEEANIMIRRGGMEISISMVSRSVETTDGFPVEIKTSVNSGAMMVMSKVMRFGDKEIEIVNSMAGQETRQVIAVPEQAFMMPHAADVYLQEQLSAGEKEVRFFVMNPELGYQPIEKIYRVVGNEDVMVMGESVKTMVLETTLMAGGMQSGREYVDSEYRSVKGMLSAGGIDMTFIATKGDIADQEFEAAELKNVMITKSDKAIYGARDLRRGVYLLELAKIKRREGQLPDGKSNQVKLPVAGYQQGKWSSKAKARITVDMDRPVRSPHDMPGDAHRKASLMLNSDDENVQKLAAQAVAGMGDDATAAEKAEKMRQFVHDFIDEKNLSVGLASASEVAQTGAGDCTEHAVLLAAMLRCEGIASRTVTGLVFVDEFLGERNVFVYHMWAQAWLGDDGSTDGRVGKWVDFDGTMDGVAFDGTHIALGNSSMADGSVMLDQSEMSSLIGRLTVKVLEGGD